MTATVDISRSDASANAEGIADAEQSCSYDGGSTFVESMPITEEGT